MTPPSLSALAAAAAAAAAAAIDCFRSAPMLYIALCCNFMLLTAAAADVQASITTHFVALLDIRTTRANYKLQL